MKDKIRIGISACLLGENVRYNGEDKRDDYLIETLGKLAELVPVCPEVECGMPVPREPMRLSGNPATPRLVTINTNIDMTEQLSSWAMQKMDWVAEENLSGFVLKAHSPSCGILSAEIIGEDGVITKDGTGIFALMLMERFPSMPVEDEESLRDPEVMKKFLNFGTGK